MTHYVCYCDGGCYNNGAVGAKAYGSFAVFRANMPIEHEALVNYHIESNMPYYIEKMTSCEKAEYIGFTNNVAEATAMLNLVNYLLKHNILTKENKVVIHSDSEIIIRQVLGIYKVKDRKLLPIIQTISRKLQSIPDINNILKIEHVSGKDMKIILGH